MARRFNLDSLPPAPDLRFEQAFWRSGQALLAGAG